MEQDCSKRTKVLGDRQWQSGDESGLVSIGTHKLYARVCGPLRRRSQPIVLIFPGSDAVCDSWTPVSLQIASFARIFLYDRSGLGSSERGPGHSSGKSNAQELSMLLRAVEIKGPYVLVAHSYGGCVAREFLQMHSEKVVGMVLSETGTESPCEHAEQQYETQILGDSPLSVIRGETTFEHSLNSSQDLTISQAGFKSQIGDASCQLRSSMLQDMAQADESLKKEQLRLSRKSKFRNVPDCGHNVHLDRPEVVIEELQWVLENINRKASTGSVTQLPKAGSNPICLKVLSKIFGKKATAPVARG